MKSKIFLVIFFLFFSVGIWAEEYKNTTIMEKLSVIKDTVYQDYKNYFTGNGLGISLIIAGVLANTSIDREIQEWYQNSLRSNDTDNFSKIIKPLGDGRKTIPVYLGTALLGEIFKNTKLLSITAEWGRKSTRAILTGVFPMLFFQRALGASRPEENDSHWRICEDNNGVSGHSFMGAIPLSGGIGLVHGVSSSNECRYDR
ncbi:MAG: hypothetical protein LWW95_08990 [Candidatus Desulfofervidus auxilii]|nr:hypothetical protein [Candidatus Desulfofervidus auxilii]